MQRSRAAAYLILMATFLPAQPPPVSGQPGWVVIPLKDYDQLRAKTATPPDEAPEGPAVDATLTRIEYDLRVQQDNPGVRPRHRDDRRAARGLGPGSVAGRLAGSRGPAAAFGQIRFDDQWRGVLLKEGPSRPAVGYSRPRLAGQRRGACHAGERIVPWLSTKRPSSRFNTAPVSEAAA